MDLRLLFLLSSLICTFSCTCLDQSASQSGATSQKPSNHVELPESPFELGKTLRKIKMSEFHKFNATGVSSFNQPGHGKNPVDIIYSKGGNDGKKLREDAVLLTRGLANEEDKGSDVVASLSRDEFIVVFGTDKELPFSPRPGLQGKAELSEQQLASVILAMDGVGLILADLSPPEELVAELKKQFGSLGFEVGKGPDGLISQGEMEVIRHLRPSRWEGCCVSSDPESDNSLLWLKKNIGSIVTKFFG